MENISHSVAGLVAGEMIHRSLPEEPQEEKTKLRRRLLLVTAAIASNFPDLDLVLTPLLPEPIGYLLHHRGHTHTLLYAIPQALFFTGLVWAFWPSARALLKESALARRGFGLAVLIGLVLHMLMDYLNSYGIHPFHPFDSRWFYGDMVFIVEPFFWVTFGIPMAMTVQRRGLRIFWIALLVGLPLFFTISGFLPWFSFAFLTAIAIGLGSLQARQGTRGMTALITSALLAVGLLGTHSFASGQAKQAVKYALSSKDPESLFLDSALTPFPTNPICWSFVSIESKESEGTYRLRRGLLSLAPQVFPVSQCPEKLARPDQQIETSDLVAYYSEDIGSINELRELRETVCYFDAWLRFARAPLVTGSVANDIRFSRDPSENFSTFKIDEFKERECQKLIPQWDFPRADLLGDSSPQGESNSVHEN